MVNSDQKEISYINGVIHHNSKTNTGCLKSMENIEVTRSSRTYKQNEKRIAADCLRSYHLKWGELSIGWNLTKWSRSGIPAEAGLCMHSPYLRIEYQKEIGTPKCSYWNLVVEPHMVYLVLSLEVGTGLCCGQIWKLKIGHLRTAFFSHRLGLK